MNEIIVTILAGLPMTGLVIAFILTTIAYGVVLGWAYDNRHDWLLTFLIVIPLTLFISLISYFFGSMV